eukprot:TRINITY_DN29465_c0_g1_i1.p1 TRINITY_DN29465_c0_g1~~TRINITY_DN29465_c0_g1_i1.p1  ORF type:complete len:131 (+),score=16.01 TRINITY_DN29465_c0_g1_i1:101-493(+)
MAMAAAKAATRMGVSSAKATAVPAGLRSSCTRNWRSMLSVYERPLQQLLAEHSLAPPAKSVAGPSGVATSLPTRRAVPNKRMTPMSTTAATGSRAAGSTSGSPAGSTSGSRKDLGVAIRDYWGDIDSMRL